MNFHFIYKHGETLRKIIFYSFFTLLLLIKLCFPASTEALTSLEYGEKVKAPNIVLNDINGKTFELSSYRGEKSVLIVFFSINVVQSSSTLHFLDLLSKKLSRLISVRFVSSDIH